MEIAAGVLELLGDADDTLNTRKFGDATNGPSRMFSVTHAAAVSVGIAPNHGSSRSDRQARWSYVHA